MLHEFLTLHRDEIIARTRQKVAARTAPRPTEAEIERGVPLFLTQLAETLRLEQQTAARPKHPTAIRVRRPARLRSSAGPMIGPTTANGAMVSKRYSSTCVRD